METRCGGECKEIAGGQSNSTSVVVAALGQLLLRQTPGNSRENVSVNGVVHTNGVEVESGRSMAVEIRYKQHMGMEMGRWWRKKN